jgi:hypothetical protein
MERDLVYENLLRLFPFQNMHVEDVHRDQFGASLEACDLSLMTVKNFFTDMIDIIIS